jgi:hypothetical protein
MVNRQNTALGSRTENLPAYFLARAKHYRFAATIKTNKREIETLCELAHMFERMAHDIQRSRARSRLTAGARSRRRCSPSADARAGLRKTWVGRFVRLSRFIYQGCP